MKLIIDKSNRLKNEESWEWRYYSNIFRLMQEDIFFENETIIFTDNLETLPINDKKDCIIFLISDEKYTAPSYINNIKVVFKNYVFPEQEELKIFPIPQGYNKSLVKLPFKNINERSYDISFQGNFHTTRYSIVNSIIQELQKRNLSISACFKQSSNMLEYSENLCNSKISLCLDGQITPENFRFFESCIFGCTIIASENLPKNWLYDKEFYYKVNWNDEVSIVDLIVDLLNNKEKLENSCTNSYNAWKNYYSENSLINYIKSKI
jgi:hypothetical protein